MKNLNLDVSCPINGNKDYGCSKVKDKMGLKLHIDMNIEVELDHVKIYIGIDCV